ncbi:hypothetical protein Bcep18194_C7136 [Burkholderia lata]|uniref:Uncharacterized protein n=1 Tax=Burkholderia lata (strain ATCC 17760 / DSM 23089 / LMG 22485 / NCIMB 9086 / R18194 / 383) TaxID=482957 RepID=Q39MY6_BURL3|nr:hypothetical protein Bcep18194_C7136 [Burkholderia lata]
MRMDPDPWLDQYNAERAHQARWCHRKTPIRTFLDSLELAREKRIPHRWLIPCRPDYPPDRVLAITTQVTPTQRGEARRRAMSRAGGSPK